MTVDVDTAPAAQAAPKTDTKREMFSREYVEELREEAKTVRLKASEYKSQLEEQAKRTADELTAKEQALEALKQETRVEVALARVEALAVKAGIVDTDALALIDRSQFKFDEAGKITNASEVLDAFKKSKPHFFGSTNTSQTEKAPTPADPQQKKSAQDMSDKEWLAFKKKHGID